MDLRINPLPSQALSGLGGLAGKRPGAAGGVDGGFADNFKSALKSVSQAQNEASRLQTQVQRVTRRRRGAGGHTDMFMMSV